MIGPHALPPDHHLGVCSPSLGQGESNGRARSQEMHQLSSLLREGVTGHEACPLTQGPASPPRSAHPHLQRPQRWRTGPLLPLLPHQTAVTSTFTALDWKLQALRETVSHCLGRAQWGVLETSF